MKTIGEAMIDARERAGLLSAELAHKAGMDPSMLYHYEKGHNFPGILSVIELADALGISIDEYIGRELKR